MPLITQEMLEKYLLALPNVRCEYPFGKETAVYKVDHAGEERLFAIIHENTHPLRISLKCEPGLAIMLREKYETVLPGQHLNKKHWNTILCTGQIGNEDLFDLMRHSYELAHPTV